MGKLSFLSLHKLYLQTKASRKSEDIIAVESLLDGNVIYSFSRSALHFYRGKIASLLSQVNDKMKQSYAEYNNGYWIMARYDWRMLPWTESLDDVDLLLAIGRAAGMIRLSYPEDQCKSCEIPHIMILDIDTRRKEQLLPEETQVWRLKYWNFAYLRF